MAQENSFLAELKALDAFWQSREVENQTDEELADEVIAYILAREQIRYRVRPGSGAAEVIDQKTLATLAKPDQLSPQHSVIEAFLRRLVQDPANAIRYLTKAVEERSAAQAARAKNNRKSRWDGITCAIHDCLENHPSASTKEIVVLLGKHEEIVFLDGEFRHQVDASTIREELLASRVSDARKRLRKKSG